MTPQKQAFRHKPDEGIYGDCFRTCVACVLDVPRDEVPHDHEAEAREIAAGDGGSQLQRMNDWLATRGLILVNIAFKADNLDLDGMLAWTKGQNPGVTFLLAGTSRTGVGHYVIVRDGEIIWDPSLNESGIVGPQEGFFWLTLIARKS